MDDTKPMTIFILVLLVTFGARACVNSMFDPTVHKAEWYSVKIPQGWEKKQKDNEVIFSSPEKDVLSGLPEAVFSIYAKKSKAALFLEDLFEEVVAAFTEMDGTILDKGDVDVAGVHAKWLLFRNKEPALILLTFYIVDDFNRLTKIQFMAKPEGFKKYRDTFEAFKDSLKYKKIF